MALVLIMNEFGVQVPNPIRFAVGTSALEFGPTSSSSCHNRPSQEVRVSRTCREIALPLTLRLAMGKPLVAGFFQRKLEETSFLFCPILSFNLVPRETLPGHQTTKEPKKACHMGPSPFSRDPLLLKEKAKENQRNQHKANRTKKPKQNKKNQRKPKGIEAPSCLERRICSCPFK